MKIEGYIATIYGLEKSGVTCKVIPGNKGLDVVVDGRVAATLSYDLLTISRSGEGNRYVTFSAPSGISNTVLTVSTADKEIIDHIVSINPSSSTLEQVALIRRQKIRGHRMSLGAGALVLALLILLVLGAMAAWRGALSFVTGQIPADMEVSIGRTNAEAILSTTNVCTDPALNAAVQEIGQRLAMGMGATPYSWQIKVLDSPEVNAYALPGGYVFINRGLIEASDDGAEVAGVLAHEFQHVLGRHGIRNVIANMGLMLVVYAVVGDVSAINAFILQNMASLAAMSFSRDQETDADVGGTDLIYRAGLDPAGLMRFMDKLAREESAIDGALTIVSTHPGSAQRKEELQALIQQRGTPKITPLKADWSAVKKLCAPQKITTPDSME